MTRSVWKGPFVEPSLIKYTANQQYFEKPANLHKGNSAEKTFKEKPILRKVWSRRSCILPEFLGIFTQIYNGRKWIALKITEEMIGHKFGEFASTRKTGHIHAEKRSNLKTKMKLKSK